MVTRNGSPLPGATVTFIPEKFLGPNVKPATGKTGRTGMAMLSMVDSPPPPGVAPGLYRVVVTVPGMNIPAKYSSEADTVLGQEVAMTPREAEKESSST